MAYVPNSGSVVAFQSDPTKLVGTFSVVGNMNSSVTAFQGGVWATSIVGVASVSQAGNWLFQPGSVSGVGTFNIDPQGAGSIISKLTNSSVTAYQGTTPWVFNGSVAVMSAVPHSVATLQGTNPWVIGNSSVTVMGIVPASVSGVGLFNVNHTGNGSVITVFSSPSIVGTYTEDTASAGNDRGIFTLGIRNDTVASLVNADLDYTGWATDSAGRHLVVPFAAQEASVYGHASTVNGGDSGSVVGVVAAGAGLRNYITDITIANTGSVATLINFTEGGGSILGRTIAPAGGGSNIIGMLTPIRNQTANQPIYVVSGTASSTLYATLRGFRAP